MMKSFLKDKIKHFFSFKVPAKTAAFFLRKNPIFRQANLARFSYYIKIYDKSVKVRLPDKKTMRLNHNTFNEVTSNIFWQGRYEGEVLDFFYGKAKSSSVIIDVGANIGYYSVIAALANPHAKIFSFEPVPLLFQLLKENLSLNRVNDHVTALQMAVTDKTGEIPLYIPRGGAFCQSSVLPGFRSGADEVKCSGISLDEFVKRQGIRSIDLIKIDAEGAEPMVLAGMKKTLKSMKPDIICEVLPGRIKKDAEHLLKESGYRFMWIADKKLVPMEGLTGDTEYRFLNYYLSAKE